MMFNLALVLARTLPYCCKYGYKEAFRLTVRCNLDRPYEDMLLLFMAAMNEYRKNKKLPRIYFYKL